MLHPRISIVNLCKEQKETRTSVKYCYNTVTQKEQQMDPKAVAAMQSFVRAMQQLDMQYAQLLVRLGCKQITLHRF